MDHGRCPERACLMLGIALCVAVPGLCRASALGLSRRSGGSVGIETGSSALQTYDDNDLNLRSVWSDDTIQTFFANMANGHRYDVPELIVDLCWHFQKQDFVTTLGDVSRRGVRVDLNELCRDPLQPGAVERFSCRADPIDSHWSTCKGEPIPPNEQA